MKYTLLIDSIRGLAGSVVEIDDSEGETLRILRMNGIIAGQSSRTETVSDLMGNVETKVIGPDITKVDAPEIKKRGRPAKVRDASDTAD